VKLMQLVKKIPTSFSIIIVYEVPQVGLMMILGCNVAMAYVSWKSEWEKRTQTWKNRGSELMQVLITLLWFRFFGKFTDEKSFNSYGVVLIVVIAVYIGGMILYDVMMAVREKLQKRKQ
jgi:drug/metabolite transporter (DMT)-like permease